MNWLKKLFHKCTSFVLVTNLYGDAVNVRGGRSVWRCTECNCAKVEQHLASEHDR